MSLGVSEDRSRTRERFNEVFKKYSESEKKKSKKKLKEAETQETIVLQNLKKNLEKDTEDDEAIFQNTYRPADGSPRYTKNQRRQRETAGKVNTDYYDPNQEVARAPKTKKKERRELPSPPLTEDAKEAKDALETEDGAGDNDPKRPNKKEKSLRKDVEDADDKLLRRYQQEIEQKDETTEKKTTEKKTTEKKTTEKTRTEKKTRTEDESSFVSQTLNNDVGKKKKKKLKSVITQSDGGDEEDDVDPKTDLEDQSEPKGKKKKKKKKHVVTEETETDGEASPRQRVFDDGLVLSVYVHRTERFQTDVLVSHPMVKVHVVDEVTGLYVKKEDSHRPVSSYYEQDNVDHVLPIMTQPFDFKKNKSIVPEWQEQIIFNERFAYFLEQRDGSPRVVLLFEILDFISMEAARANVDAPKHERGFRKIAWAFLKLVGTNGALNIDSKLRLQLFCPPARAKRQPKTIEVAEWWRKYPRNKYASTLYVTVKGIRLPEHVDPSIRSMMALQEERGSTSYSELQNEVTRRTMTQHVDSKPPALRWSRLPGQVCRIPNKSMQTFRGGQMGCLTLLFSHAGTMMAAACADRDAFPVVVYEIPSGKVLAAFSGHFKIVYDLCWSPDDRTVLSASSDGTVREWNVERLQAAAQRVLPHPSFVYSARYHPAAPRLAVSGGYDALLRVWTLDADDVNGRLLQEFEGHGSFINSICFDSEGSRMFSADNAGVILVWRTTAHDSKRHPPCHRWSVVTKISESDLGGVPISMLQLHPNGRSLLVHAKDSVLRVMDLRILAVKKYIGAINYRERIYSTFTPCGNFLFSGSEDGMAYVWNTDTGDQVAVYSELCYPTALHGVAFHPHENMVAFCAFGQSQPIRVYLYDRKVSQLEAHHMKARSRSASADTRTTPDPAAFQDASAGATVDQFATVTRMALKMQYVKEQLDSVLSDPQQRSGYVYEQDKMSTAHTTGRRSFTADSGTTSLLSPHAQLQLSGQKRGFSPVGQRLKGTFQTSLQDDVPPGDPAPIQQVVVSLHDYAANRSDELSTRRGDVITVLYKDNHDWWFGRTADGQQGYFLAANVANHTGFNDEVTAERATPTRVSAAISSSGELRFLSEPTLSDTEPESTDAKARRKKKVKPTATRRSGRATDRPLPTRPSGRTNGAFQPEA